MLNQALIVGRLVNDIELKDNKCEITLAVSRQSKNEDGIYITDYITCQLWDGIATNTAEYCHKGDLIGIKGRLQTEDDKLIIMAEKITFLSTKKEN